MSQRQNLPKTKKPRRPSPRRSPFRLSALSSFMLEDRTVPTNFSVTNSTPILIPGSGTNAGVASPYPSAVQISVPTGEQITSLQVVFNNLSHSAPHDIDALLIAPNGDHIYLMSDCGGDSSQPINSVTLTFSDSGVPLTTGQIFTGTYQPTNIDEGDPDTIPPFTGEPTLTSNVFTTLSQFQGVDPNGNWYLAINEDDSFDSGVMQGGWTLTGTTRLNHAPVANNDSYTFNENGTLTTTAATGVQANDTDADNDPLTSTLITGPSHGTLTFNADGSFNYVPLANFSGTDSFTYKDNDGIVDSNVATATINVTHINQVPVAFNDNLTVQNGGIQTIHKAVLVFNDIDPDQQYTTNLLNENFNELPLQPFNAGTIATPTASGMDWTDALPTGWTRDNTTTPMPPSPSAAGAEFYGWHLMNIDSWIAQQGDQDRSKFLLANPGTGNTVVVADGDAYDDFVSLSTNKMNTYLYTPEISLAGINAQTLALQVDSSFRPESPDPNHQVGDIQESFDGGTTWIELQHFSNANSGGTGGELNINDHLTYNNLNPASATQVEFRFGYTMAGNDWWWAIDNVKVTGGRTDPAQETIQIQSQPAHGTVSIDTNGAVIYTPNPLSYVGPDSFTYQDYDGFSNSNTATVNLTVNANTVAPVANNDNFTTGQGIPVSVHYDQSLLANDTDTDLGGGNVGMRAILVSAPAAAQGTVTLNPDGTFVFTPTTSFVGNATFTYQTNDGTYNSNTATVTIAVTQTNNFPPVATNDSYSVNNNGTLTVPATTGVLANDTDADSNPLTAVATVGPNGVLTGPSHGTLTFNADGSFTYVPLPFFNGTDSFTYQAFDGKFYSNTATVMLTVNAVNVAPQANGDTYSTKTNTPLTVNGPGVLANDRDDGPNTQLFAEGFNELPLIPFNTGVPGGSGSDYTEALPAGWVRDNTNTPAPPSLTSAGAEFDGWHVMNIDSWIAEQGNQARADFLRGGVGSAGTVVVADGDAYDDFVDIHTGTNRMNTYLYTPEIPLGSILPNSLELQFDSSFRPENPPPGNQVGEVDVSYDGGTTWTDIKDLNTANQGGVGSRLNTNDHLTVDANNPAGATQAEFRFGYLQATNNWWWAIDNVQATGSTANAGANLTAQIVAQPPANQGTVSLNANGSFTFTPANGFTGVAKFTYLANDAVNNSAPATVNIVVGPQAAVQVDDGTAQRSRVRSLTVTFAGVATFAGSPSAAFTLTDSSGNAVPFSVATTTVNGGTVATITFTGSNVVAGSLADGRYTLTVLSSQVSIGGQALDGTGSGTPSDLVLDFLRLYGDYNGDGLVNNIDLAQFRAALGTSTGSAGYMAAFDYNGDGLINNIDLVQFRNRLGTSI